MPAARLACVVLLAWPAAALAEARLHPAFGLDGGFALQGDQYVAGGRAGLSVEPLRFLALELVALGGLGPDHFTGRASLRLRPELRIDRFRASLIAGASLYGYWPRGPFATFCDKADLDCSAGDLGLEAGVGVGFGPVRVDLVAATGEVPLYTLTAGVIFEP